MAYELLQTCMAVPVDLDRSACASWVQAWGSLAAICLAAWIARRDGLLRAAVERAERAQRLLDFAGVLTTALDLMEGIRLDKGQRGRIAGRAEYIRSRISTVDELLRSSAYDRLPSGPWVAPAFESRLAWNHFATQMDSAFRLIDHIDRDDDGSVLQWIERALKPASELLALRETLTTTAESIRRA